MDLNIISWILIIAAFISQTIAGILDMTGIKKICYKRELCLSKSHLWKDSIFLLIVAITINVINRSK